MKQFIEAYDAKTGRKGIYTDIVYINVDKIKMIYQSKDNWGEDACFISLGNEEIYYISTETYSKLLNYVL